MRAASRPFLERIAALDRSIRAGEHPNAGSIGRGLEVNPRTIQRDIAFLRDRMKAPLVFVRAENGYAYSDPSYRLVPEDRELGDAERAALHLAELVLRALPGTPYGDDLSAVLRRLTAGLDPAAASAVWERARSFRSTATSAVDPALARRLDQAIVARRRLSIVYWTASRDSEDERLVDPLHLATIDHRPYLIAYCHLRGAILMFSPSRIRTCVATDQTFDPPASFAVDAYLADCFSSLRGPDGELFDVLLRFTGDSVRYVRERTWHPSQTIEECPDGSIVLSLRLGHLREIERWALSWGSECEVLGPPELRFRVADELAVAAARYLHDTNQDAKQTDHVDKSSTGCKATSGGSSHAGD